ncbi:hypothetical protein BCV70DRAFT_73754 [Testicularia cyperi]|uniref:Uncharacterized protein n=1 Tax=Testicularia cyperi TaxID=1882483 RepID=A0A317XUE5_9BASI|nr:hypothetical protein BCV70DRAFT_73754 [Testicularia cyperi]
MLLHRPTAMSIRALECQLACSRAPKPASLGTVISHCRPAGAIRSRALRKKRKPPSIDPVHLADSARACTAVTTLTSGRDYCNHGQSLRVSPLCFTAGDFESWVRRWTRKSPLIWNMFMLSDDCPSPVLLAGDPRRCGCWRRSRGPMSTMQWREITFSRRVT